jgi:hypothetical protein
VAMKLSRQVKMLKNSVLLHEIKIEIGPLREDMNGR